MQDSMINKADYVEIGLTCADVCEALSRRMNTGRADQLNHSILEAIRLLTL